MQVDKIIKNAKVFTSNKDQLDASAFAVKDGKFVYVGDEAGLDDFTGEEIDLAGKFVMPGLIDAHVHLPVCVGALSLGDMHFVPGSSKDECIQFMKDVVNSSDEVRYTFLITLASLAGEMLTQEDLDTVSSEKEIFVVESEMHSS